MFYNECKSRKIHQVQQYNAQIMFPYTSKMTTQNTTKYTPTMITFTDRLHNPIT